MCRFACSNSVISTGRMVGAWVAYMYIYIYGNGCIYIRIYVCIYMCIYAYKCVGSTRIYAYICIGLNLNTNPVIHECADPRVRRVPL